MNNTESKTTPEIFIFDEGKFTRAVGEMKGYCNSANKILEVLKNMN